MTKTPLKVVVFTAGTMAMHTIERLVQQQQLAGVVLTNRQDLDAHQLEHWLYHCQIPFVRYQPDSPESIAHQLECWGAELGVIFTFSHILPAQLLNRLRLGVYNLHASALPKYKGPQPLYWQIRNGETDTHLALHRAVAKVDSGDIVMQRPLPIHPLDTLQSLSIQVAQHGAQLIVDFIRLVQTQGLPRGLPQQGLASFAPRPCQTTLAVNWQTMTAKELVCAARAGNPAFNGVAVLWNQASFNVLQATEVDHPRYGVPAGTVVHVGEPEGLMVATKEGVVRLDVIACSEGVFSGLAFACRFQLDAGMQLLTPDTKI